MNDVEIELRAEIRELALTMVRFERWASEAAERGKFGRVAECVSQRDLAQARRSNLLRELWMREQT